MTESGKRTYRTSVRRRKRNNNYSNDSYILAGDFLIHRDIYSLQESENNDKPDL